MKTSVDHLLSQKEHAIYTVDLDATVEDAVKEMNNHKIGFIMVLSSLKLVGVFSERDVLVRVVAEGRIPKATPVSKVMTTDVRTISPDDTAEQALEIMTNHRCRHLPVMRDDQLVGLLPIGDVTRWIARTHQLEADHLRSYVTGTPW
ncbi:MAG: CBS domain-containing protein [Opitutales bacterium]